MTDTIPSSRTPLRMLVAVASYGTSNDRHLLRLIEEYRSMAFALTIVVLSDRHKQLRRDVEIRVGLPDKNPWSLPFAHKEIFAERLEDFDLFVYSEDDILITEKNLRSFLKVSENVQEDELPGFIRFESDADGQISYPDVQFHFHWTPTSVVSRGLYKLANFTNDHAACYALTQPQLRKALVSGGFLIGPQEWRYDLLCSAATDPYTRCGFTKLIPISHLDDFLVHHLSNKYAGKFGISDAEMRLQIDELLQIEKSRIATAPLVRAETNLWHATYSKDYYEPACEEILSRIPSHIRSVLSIGSGWGATERRLVERGIRVVAMPLDTVISRTAAAAGVEIVHGDFDELAPMLKEERFDCALLLNVLHFFRDPVAVLAACKEILPVGATIMIQAPNMLCVSNILRRYRRPSRYRGLGTYELAGVHTTSPATIRRWCKAAGLKADTTVGLSREKRDMFYDRVRGAAREIVPDVVMQALAPDFIAVTHKH
jgi:Cyclopropane fatty acid synthase and related methyltransferases